MKLKVLLVMSLVMITAFAFAEDATLKPYVKAQAWGGIDKGTDKNSKLGFGDTGYSRIGIDATKGDLTMKLEFGSDTKTLRQAYAQWDFGMGKMTVGHMYTPYTTYLSVAVKDDGGAYAGAGLDDGRQGVLMFEMSGAYIAFMQPNIDASTGSYIGEEEYPKVAVGYTTKVDIASIGVHAGYQKGSISAYDAYFVNTKIGLDMGQVYSNITGSFSVNPKSYGFGFDTEISTKAGKGSKDAKVFQGGAEVGFKVGTIAAIEVGGTFQQADNGTSVKEMSYFAQVPVTATENFTITPAVWFRDYEVKSELQYGVLFTAFLK